MMVTKVRRLPLVVSGVQGGIWFTDCVADWVRNRRTVIAASCPGVSRRKFAREGRWEGENGWDVASVFSFPWSLALRLLSLACHTRFALASVRKRSAWRGDSCKYMSRETKASLAMGPFHCRLAGWLPDQLFDVLSSDWLSDWLTDLPVDLKTDELIDWLTDWLTDWPINGLGVTVEQTDCSTASDWRTDGPIAY